MCSWIAHWVELRQPLFMASVVLLLFFYLKGPWEFEMPVKVKDTVVQFTINVSYWYILRLLCFCLISFCTGTLSS
jgi:hypothetical protein